MPNLEQTAKILGGLAILYPRFNLTRETIHAYHRILGDLPVDLLDAAALEIGRNNTFFPAAAELRKAAFNLTRVADGTLNAQDAWAMVKKAFGAIGHTGGMPDHFPPIVKKAVEGIGGWRSLCMSENDMSDRARFVESFNAYSAREQNMTEMLPQVRAMLPNLAAGNGRKQLQDGE